MKGADFRARAVAEGLRYGEDKLVFVRELAQNGRDAGATKLAITATHVDDCIWVTFTDNGIGMSEEHARRFLFTLYASSKENDIKSAGRFGVGFWSILLFEPHKIIIESKTDDPSTFGFSFDETLKNIQSETCTLNHSGTRITLIKKLGHQRPSAIISKIHLAAQKYCRFLRQNTKTPIPLPLSFNGQLINEPFKIDGPCWMGFNSGKEEGAIGLGPKPLVELYVRGLPVWQGTMLDELRYDAEPKEEPSEVKGLAPVYILNGNNLSVTLNRRAVIDDRALGKLRSHARKKMRELLTRYLDSISPRPFWTRIKDWGHAVIDDLRYSGQLLPIGIISLCVLVAVALFFIFGPLNSANDKPGKQPISKPSTTGQISLADASTFGLSVANDFQGPVVSTRGQSTRLDLEYAPANSAFYFRKVAVETLHAGRGIVSALPTPVAIAPTFQCKKKCTSIKAAVSALPGILSLPVPTGYQVSPQSVKIDNNSAGPIMLTEQGDFVLSVPHGQNGQLTYTVGPKQAHLSNHHREKLLEIPENMPLPAPYNKTIFKAKKNTNVHRRVEIIANFVEQTIAYDCSEPVAKAYRELLRKNPTNGWTTFVTQFAKGDCDIKNTLAILMLRKAGVPARLAVGFTGTGGITEMGMHAWIEYYNNSWHIADATGEARGASDLLSNPQIPYAETAPQSPNTNTGHSATKESQPENKSNKDPHDSFTESTITTRNESDVQPLNPKISTRDDNQILQRPNIHKPSSPRNISKDTIGPIGVQNTFPSTHPPAVKEQSSTLVNIKHLLQKNPTAIQITLLMLICLAVSLTAIGLFLTFNKTRRDKIRGSKQASHRRRIAAKMMTGLLMHPDIWLKSSGLTKRKVLPLLGSQKRISLKNALAKSEKGTLWFSKNHPPMAKQAAKNAALIIDTSIEEFADLIALIPKAKNLDLISQIKAISTKSLAHSDPELAKLIEALRGLLRLYTKQKFKVVPCQGIFDVLAKDVDLTSLNIKGPTQIPRRFIGLSTSNEIIVQLAQKQTTDLSLRAFFLLDALLDKSKILWHVRRELRIVAAKHIVSAKQPVGAAKPIADGEK